MKLTPEILTICKYLGYYEPSIEECIKITSMRTLENYNRFITEHPEMIPVITDGNNTNYFCLGSLDIILDWSTLVKIANELRLESISTDKDKAISLLAEKILWC